VLLASVSSSFTSQVANHGAYAVFGLMAIDAVFPAFSELVMLYAGAVGAGVFAAAHHVSLFGGKVGFGAGAYIVMALAGTLGYLEDTAIQAGVATALIDVAEIGWNDGGSFVDAELRPLELVFKLYPWEWMFDDEFGKRLLAASTRWIEPPWKAILSNKGILPLLWERFPDHPNLLPAFFDDDPNAATLGSSFVRKPLYSREGANVALVSDGVIVVEQEGPYGAEGFIRQALAPLPNFSGQYPVVGSWLVDHAPCGLSIREDENPITGDGSRFLPHAIL